MDKLTSQHIAEIAKSFHPKAEVVTSLPDVKKAKDLQEYIIDNKDGTFTKHQMINGVFRKGSTYS